MGNLLHDRFNTIAKNIIKKFLSRNRRIDCSPLNPDNCFFDEFPLYRASFRGTVGRGVISFLITDPRRRCSYGRRQHLQKPLGELSEVSEDFKSAKKSVEVIKIEDFSCLNINPSYCG